MFTAVFKKNQMTRRLDPGEIKAVTGLERSEEPREAEVAPKADNRETNLLDRNLVTHAETAPYPKQKKEERVVARTLRDVADECRKQGKYQQAESLYRRALAIAESTFGPDHLEISGILNNLAVLYKYTGNFDEAERL